MNLKDLAKKPSLIKMTLDDEETVQEYGEPIDFYTWDRQPIDSFLKIANSASNDLGAVITAVKDLVLDEEGKPVMSEDYTLPNMILQKVINKIVNTLGK